MSYEQQRQKPMNFDSNRTHLFFRIVNYPSHTWLLNAIEAINFVSYNANPTL